MTSTDVDSLREELRDFRKEFELRLNRFEIEFDKRFNKIEAKLDEKPSTAMLYQVTFGFVVGLALFAFAVVGLLKTLNLLP